MVVKKDNSKKEELFEDLPVEKSEEEAKENLDKMIQRIKESKEKAELTEKQPPKQPQEKEEVVDTVVPKPIKKTAVDIKKLNTQTKNTPEQKKDNTKDNTQNKKTINKKEYFIQVASLAKFEPNKNFLLKITQNGFNYKIVNRKVNGNLIKRVYVGPFSSQKEAKQAIKKVKKSITKSAFIIKD